MSTNDDIIWPGIDVHQSLALSLMFIDYLLELKLIPPAAHDTTGSGGAAWPKF